MSELSWVDIARVMTAAMKRGATSGTPVLVRLPSDGGKDFADCKVTSCGLEPRPGYPGHQLILTIENPLE